MLTQFDYNRIAIKLSNTGIVMTGQEVSKIDKVVNALDEEYTNQLKSDEKKPEPESLEDWLKKSRPQLVALFRTAMENGATVRFIIQSMRDHELSSDEMRAVFNILVRD